MGPMENKTIHRDRRWITTGPALAAALLLAGCPQSVPGGEASPDAGISMPDPDPDASTGPQIAGLEIVPNDFSMYVGDQRQLDVQLVDDNDDVVPR